MSQTVHSHRRLPSRPPPGRGRAANFGEFLDGLIGEWEARGGSDKLTAGTITNRKQIRGKLLKFFGEATELRNIEPVDAKRWRDWLGEHLAQATVASHVKRAKLLAREAVERDYLAVSPFDHLIAGDDSNVGRPT